MSGNPFIREDVEVQETIAEIYLQGLNTGFGVAANMLAKCSGG